MRHAFLAVLYTALLSSCSVDTWKEVASDAGEFAVEQSLRATADVVRSQLQPLYVDSRLPVAGTIEKLKTITIVADLDIPDVNNDGYVDGGQVGVSIGGKHACIDFTNTGQPITTAPCTRS